ncbi:MAG TPA: NAD(P)H-dependent oxidoreductase subunit E [Syntrophales bacterium]|nr:NAD(P)H-dependent oxidoreductase subunit E [Syntrophales bacterium]
MTPEAIEKIVAEHAEKQGSIIAILEDIQNRYRYLPEEALRIVARRTGKSLVDVYGVATFYKAFSLKPRGKRLISVCLGTACHVRGGQAIAEEFTQQLGITAGETTPDREITLETVNCLGACALGPTVVVDGHYHPHVSKRQVNEIIAAAREGAGQPDAQDDRRFFPLQAYCPACKKSLLDPDHRLDGHPAIRCDVSFDGREGWLRLSSLYGSRAMASEHEIPMSGRFRLYCPHCRNGMPHYSNCTECGSPMAALFIRPGCAYEVCTLRGCDGHLLNLEQPNMT